MEADSREAEVEVAAVAAGRKAANMSGETELHKLEDATQVFEVN